jgi:hypothetical protein
MRIIVITSAILWTFTMSLKDSSKALYVCDVPDPLAFFESGFSGSLEGGNIKSHRLKNLIKKYAIETIIIHPANKDITINPDITISDGVAITK